MGLVVSTPPANLPVGLNEVRDWCRIDTADGDATLTALIQAAVEHVSGLDGFSALALITQTFDWTMDAFPTSGALDFPRWPVQSVTSISYIDADGAPQTWAAEDYQVDTKSKPARLTFAFGGAWPSAQAIYNAVTIRFVAGYGDEPEDIPESLRTAIKVLVANWTENREGSPSRLPVQVRSMIAKHRLSLGVG